jgi:hypothetical protein
METTNTIKVMVNFKDQARGVDVEEGATMGDVIDSIRDDMGIPEAVLTKVDGIALDSDYVVKDKEEIFVSLAEITYGPNSVDVGEFIGKKLGEALNEFGQVLNIPTDNGKMEAEVNGKPKKLRYRIQPGDRIVIEKKKGRKL